MITITLMIISLIVSCVVGAFYLIIAIGSGIISLILDRGNDKIEYEERKPIIISHRRWRIVDTKKRILASTDDYAQAKELKKQFWKQNIQVLIQDGDGLND